MYNIQYMLNSVEELLAKKHVSARKMCTELNYSPNIISELRTGRTKYPNLKFVIDVANYLGVSITELLGQKDKPNADSVEFSESEKYLINLFRLVPDDMKGQLVDLIQATLKSRGLLK